MKDKKILFGIISILSFGFIVFITVIVMFIHYLNDNIDSCLDHGGCWNEVEQQCEMQNNSKCKKP